MSDILILTLSNTDTKVYSINVESHEPTKRALQHVTIYHTESSSISGVTSACLHWLRYEDRERKMYLCSIASVTYVRCTIGFSCAKRRFGFEVSGYYQITKLRDTLSTINMPWRFYCVTEANASESYILRMFLWAR